MFRQERPQARHSSHPFGARTSLSTDTSGRASSACLPLATFCRRSRGSANLSTQYEIISRIFRLAVRHVKCRAPRGEFEFGLSFDACGRRCVGNVAAVFRVARPERETPSAFGNREGLRVGVEVAEERGAFAGGVAALDCESASVFVEPD